ncbi:hypothetical protein [Anaeromyxobacter sp. Fw109-5]|uniref:hypothetical protein n=1 Tax=Anaeromyxobacter sp. (strain Fw109-5) TaxID=404589 RepID=UPI0000ED6DC3|nr:hypothetical protein [Anaeromyxobacter sp. Fw109-5]ABS28250.1 hypothetical protein Anae109_4072 [Anaeromyxobacter sp. Fw109-5]
MASPVPWFVWPIVLAVNLALVASSFVALRRHGAGRGATVTASLLAAWFALAVGLSAAGLFAGAPDRLPGIGLGVFPPLLAGALALALSPSLRARALAVPQAWLVGVQSLRLVGVVFLVLLARGVLPSAFALSAGWGDVAVGSAAPVVALALAARKRWAPGAALAWNVLGLVDLAAAIALGALSADGPLRLFSGGPTTNAMAELPLSLIPTFGVPIFVLLHVVSLLGLRARAKGRGEPARAGPAPALAR